MKKKTLNISKKCLTAFIIIVLTFNNNVSFFGSISYAQEASPSGSQRLESMIDISASESAVSKIDKKLLDNLVENNEKSQLKGKTTVQTLGKKSYQYKEKIVFNVYYASEKGVSVFVKNRKGEKILAQISETRPDEDTVRVALSAPWNLEPGKYSLEIVEDGKVISSQSFNWGVLAINPDKSIYLFNEKANFAIAVLDERGEMICNADLIMNIKDPLGNAKILSTDSGEIKVNDQCNSKELSLTPDYEATFETENIPGDYTLQLSATTDKGTFKVEDTFEVREAVDFDVTRVSATRLFPKNYYPVEFNVNVNADFKGRITEVVPENFEVKKSSSSAVLDYEKVEIVAQSEVTAEKVLGTRSLRLPFEGEHDITLGFGQDLLDPALIGKYKEFGLIAHDGTDFSMPVGTDIYPIDDGEVVLAEENGDYGMTMVIQHEWGRSYYGHLSEFKKKLGDKVSRDEVIALSGNSGLTTGSHLHLGIKLNKNDRYNGFYGKINPAMLLGLENDGKVLGESADPRVKVKVITWNIDVKRGDKVSLGYQFKAPSKSPEFYRIGPLKFFDEDSSLVFQESRQWQLAADTPTGDGMLIYDEDAANSQSPHYRTWAPSDISSESDLRSDGTIISDANHTIVKSGSTRDEYIRGTLDDTGTLNVQVYASSTWGYGTSAPTEGNFTTTIGTTQDVKRLFDIAYEHTSGDALVVYEDTTTTNKNLKYRTWNGTSWSSEQTLDYTSVAEGGSNDQAEWIVLKERTVSSANEIMLGWKDMTGDGIYGAVWDGSAWQNIALINGAGVNNVRRSFDIAWEGTSDQGMIVYGTGTTTDHSVYDISDATWTDGSSSVNPGEAVDWLSLAGDVDTDYIAMIIVSGASTTTSDVAVDMWNGTNWTTVTTPSDDTDIDTYGFSQGADVAWEQTGDRALFAWRDDSASTGLTTLRYMVYDISANQFQAIDDNSICLLTEGGAGTTEQVTSLSAAEDSNGPCTGLGTWAGTVSGIVLYPDPSSSDIALFAQNETVLDIRPEMQLWNGDANGSWLTQTGTMGAFETDASPGTLPTSTVPIRTYDFAWKQSSADNTGLLVYDEDGANNQPPHYRAWSGSDLGSEGNLIDYLTVNSTESVFNVVKAAPTRDEYIAGRLASDGQLNIQMWDGDSWEYGTGAPDSGTFTRSISTANAVNRGFDIAYEQTTGDAIVVYEDSSTADKTLKYRTWNGTTWSSEQTLDYSAVAESGSNDVAVWVELVARAGGDEIMLGWQDKTGLGYYGAVWDGSTWQDISLINGAGVSVNQQSFDVAWEGTSDQGMILYGTGTTTDYSVYDISAGTWTDGSGSVNTGGATVWVRLDNDPSSDYIAAIIIDTLSTTSADIQVDMWNGSDWTTISVPTADTDINTYGFAQGADVAWEANNSGGRALFVWRNGIIAGTTTAETSLVYMVYDRTANAFQEIDDNSVCLLTEGGAGTTETVTSLDANEDSGGPCNGLGSWAGTVSGIILEPDPSSNKIALIAENETVLDVRPEMQLWNGDSNGSWLTQTANMGAFETDASLGTLPNSTTSTKPYSIAFNKFGNTPPTIATNDVPFDNQRTPDTTPDFEFTGSDGDGDDLSYRIQIDDTYDFSSVVVDCTSSTSCATGAGSFSNTVSGGDTDPFNESEKIRFTPSTTLSSGTTYYWRVNVNDGTDTSSYSTIQSFTINTGLSQSDWFQTTDEQFDTDTLTSTATTGSDSVGLSGGGGGSFTFEQEVSGGIDDTNSKTLTFSTSPTEDNLIIIFARLQDTSSAIFTWPSGFTELWNEDVDGANAAAYKVAGASEGTSYSVSWDDASFGQGWYMAEISGADSTSPIDVSPVATQEGFVSSYDTGGITTNTDGALHIIGYQSREITTTPPTGYTEEVDSNQHWLATKVITSAGSTGTFTISKSNWYTVSFEFALKPAAALASSGTVMSTAIDYDSVSGATSWGTFDWSEDETDGTVALKLYYNNGSDCDTIVPDGALSGNSSGFSSGSIDISGLNTTTYNRICLQATLTNSTGSPYLTDWTVTWDNGGGPETPTLSQLMRHGRWFNSSGVIQPFTF